MSDQIGKTEENTVAPQVVAASPAQVYPDIYLADQDFQLPESGTYYVIGKNGIFLNKSNILGEGLIKVDGISNSDLQDIKPRFQSNLPVVPGRIIWQAWQFFREVWHKYHAESYVTLLYSKQLNQYMLWCPKQSVTGGSVNYDRGDQPSLADRVKYGWKAVGTIHSHCNFSAFHSGVDTDDEESFDGLHITLGHNDREAPSMVSSFAINGNRIPFEPTEVMEVIQMGADEEDTAANRHWKRSERDRFFQPYLEENSDAEQESDLQTIQDEWMPKVSSGYAGGRGKKHKTYGGNNFNTNSNAGLWDQDDELDKDTPPVWWNRKK